VAVDDREEGHRHGSKVMVLVGTSRGDIRKGCRRVNTVEILYTHEYNT
jgi:hypothetical protein